MPDKTYDVAIIGSGPAGYTAAIRAGQWGLSVALIEKDARLGGTCLQVGCIPTKALLFNAEVYDHIKSAAELGLELSGATKVNWPVIQQRKDKIVTKHTKGLEFLMRKNKVEVIAGYGRLTGPAQNGVLSVEVAGQGGENKSIRSKNVIVATGSSARLLPGLEPDLRVLT
ncbi:MAG TPA: FAD-dependent oxidoreductase, partial [Terriglobales bacterium]